MKPKKKFLKRVLILLFFLFLCLAIGIYKNRDTTKMISIEMQLLNQEDIPILSSVVDEPYIEFNFDFIVQSDFNCKAQLMLLKNFKITPFSLNGREENTKYTVDIMKSDEYMQSKGNRITIHNLDNYNNDFCLLLVFENSIFTKRFQVINTSVEKKTDPNYIEAVNVTDFEYEDRYLLPNMQVLNPDGGITYLDDVLYNNTINCAVNIEKVLEPSNTYEQYMDAKNENIIYAIIPVINNGEVFGDVVYVKTDKSIFAFSYTLDMNTEIANIRFIIFPYANSYNDDFLKTYKAFLWSDPVITYKINRKD